MTGNSNRKLQLAVIGAGSCSAEIAELAHQVGFEIAQRGALLICGGGAGVMEAAARGARQNGGATLGILPGVSAAASPPNAFIDIPVFTGLGQARNQVIVLSADAVIGISGGWGTLTEIGLALKHGIPVVLLESWSLERPDGVAEPLLHTAASPKEAVELAIHLATSQIQ